MVKTLLGNISYRSILRISIILIIVGCFLFGFDITFAQGQSIGGSLQESVVDDLGSFAVSLIKILTWLWIVPASLAGELITNKFAFGSAFYLDRYLFQIWQFMRTLAYFTLAAVFIGTILKIFVKQENLKKYGILIGKTVGAGLLIGGSWFIMSALVDLSIIGTSAVASIPLQTMQAEFQEMEGKLSCPKKVEVKEGGSIDEFSVVSSGERELSFEDIMPKGDSVSGPLIFMGCGLLNFFESGKIDTDAKTNTDSILLLGIKLIMNLMLILPMVVLMIVNLMRIFFIWLWIIFAPFIVLDVIFKGPLTGSSKYQKYFSLSNIFALVFQPVVVVGALSIGMLMIMGIYNVQIGGVDKDAPSALSQHFNIENAGDSTSKIGNEILGEVYILGSSLEDSISDGVNWVGGLIGELVLAGFCIVLVWSLIKLAFEASAITKSTADKLYNTAKGLMMNVPLVPTRFGNLGIGGMQQMKDVAKRKINQSMHQKQRVDADRLDKMFGLESEDGITSTEWGPMEDRSDARGIVRSVGFWNEMKKLQQKKAIPTRSTKFRSLVETWAATQKDKIIRHTSINSDSWYDEEYNIHNMWRGTREIDRKMRRLIEGLLQSPQTSFPDTGWDAFFESFDMGDDDVLQDHYGPISGGGGPSPSEGPGEDTPDDDDDDSEE